MHIYFLHVHDSIQNPKELKVKPMLIKPKTSSVQH